MLDALKYSLTVAVGGKNTEQNAYAIEYRIKELKQTMLDLVQITAKSGADEDRYDAQIKKISDELGSLKERLQKEERRQSGKENNAARLNEIFQTIESETFGITEYDDTIVRQFIECVKVLSAEKILIIFNGGIEMEAQLQI